MLDTMKSPELILIACKKSQGTVQEVLLNKKVEATSISTIYEEYSDNHLKAGSFMDRWPQQYVI